MSTPNTWHCSNCNFDVFNSKSQCNKCLTKKPEVKSNSTGHTFYSYDPEFDREVCNYFQQSRLESVPRCSRCRKEGRLLEKDPMLSVHNCWKYS